ncbi:PAS domain-containing protein [Leptolyngbya sp. ST-U4]|uniref:PAS domain-containing protein n=1 Tax=Leptolyngbya sp. ST-U4 TaxID=2933912 RepID=UPI0032974899
MAEAVPPPIPKSAARPVDETERLEALRYYNILDTPSEAAFDRITALAARLFDVPMVFVSLMDESRAWFKSCYGFDQQEIPRDVSLCSFALLGDDVLIIPDALQDDRFSRNPFVQGEPGVRFYASAPLLTENRVNLGTLSLVDTKPRPGLTDEQQATLIDLAAIVMDELELRLAARRMAQVDAALLKVTQGVSAVTGKAFFTALVQHLATALGVNYACITLLMDDSPETIKTIAFYAEGKIADNLEYPLKNTPCLEVIRQRKIVCYGSQAQALFPDDRFLVSLGIESYAAIPFFNSQGTLLGLLGVMDNKPIENVQLVESLLTLFAVQIAAELERQQAEDIQQEAAQRLQLYADIVRNTQVGIVVWQLEDPNNPESFRLLIANPAASETVGLNFEPLIGKTMAESFPKLLQTPLVQQYLEVIQTGRPIDLGEVSYGEDGISTGFYALKAFALPDRCLGLAFENITVRKQIETQLKESQRYSQQIAEAMPGILFVHDILEQRNIYTNRQIADLLGYSSEQIQAMGTDVIAILIHPDDRQRVLSYSESFQTAADNEVLGIEYRAHHANDEWRWFYTQSVVFNRTTDGLPCQILGVSIDISDRKQSEQALQESEAWTRIATQVAQVGGWRLHLETNLVEIDQRMRQIWGEPDDLVMIPLSTVLERIHPDDRKSVAEAVAAALDPASAGTYEIEYRVVWNDGTERWISAKGQARFEGEGSARRTVDFFGTALDITSARHGEAERKRAQSELVEQEQRYRYIFESVGVAIWEEDFSEAKVAIDQLKAAGVQDFRQYFADHPEFVQQMAQLIKPQDVNQAALTMFGAQEKRELLASLEKIFVPETQAAFAEELLAIANEETFFVTETVLQTLQGERLHVWFSITFPPASESYDHVLVSLLDITQRKQVEQALQQQTEDLVQANRIKDEFLAVLSHELRSPLNPILGWSKLLQTGRFDAQKTQQALAIIERNAKQQTQLIDDLLDISKILRGKLASNKAPVNLVLTIEAALETVRLAAEAKNIQIKTDFDSSFLPVLGDSGRLQQIVSNLLSNAIKFTPSDGQVEVQLKRVGSEAQLQVRDTGKGIALDFLPYVFESFRQEDGKTTRKFGGLGLGLAIVRQLVELHGGTVRAESKGEGTGATFTVRLPLLKRIRAGEMGQWDANSSLTSLPLQPLTGLRILVVDDEADMRELAVAILEQAGAIVQITASAAEALEVLTGVDRFQPALLISDIGMPDIDGYSLIQQVRALPPDQGGQIPAIALTAYASKLDQQQALQAGFQKHISKPIEPEVFIQAIVNLVGSATVQREPVLFQQDVYE